MARFQRSAGTAAKPGTVYYSLGEEYPESRRKVPSRPKLGSLVVGVSTINGRQRGPRKLVGWELFGDKYGEWCEAILEGSFRSGGGPVLPDTLQRASSRKNKP